MIQYLVDTNYYKTQEMLEERVKLIEQNEEEVLTNMEGIYEKEYELNNSMIKKNNSDHNLKFVCIFIYKLS